MKPDRSNYEIWFIDWLDGNLDESLSSELMKFIEANPDLKEEFDSLSLNRLSGGTGNFKGKENLFRSASDLTVSQVEYLSVASLENDLTPDEMADLDLNLSRHPENKVIYESIRKMKLIPPDLRYRNKGQLKKYSGRLFRNSIPVISAAAAIAVLILSYIFIPRLLSGGEDRYAGNIDTLKSNTEPIEVRTLDLPARQEAAAKLVAKNMTVNKLTVPPVSPEIQNLSSVNNITKLSVISSRSDSLEISLVNIPVITGFRTPVMTNNLIASNNHFIAPVIDEERSRLSRFLARTFREKLLREDSPDDTPVSTYEIAEVGIGGLNKLFGWDMVLVKTNDESGELKSIYFSSKVLKFNAPVRKAEQAR